ncbi:MAG TPA: hypothetical protein VFN97_18770 [Actinospica sp.]|nr:hypothetical protein [Actinospica sp.]
MSGHNEQDLFVTDPSGPEETGIEQAVRTTLERHATRVPLQDPPVAQLLGRGRSRRRRRDALRVAAALVIVAGGVVGGYAARVGTSGAATSQVVGAATRPSSTASVSTDGYHATVPKNWKPGAKLPLNSYSSVPSWVQAKDAATELGGDKKKGHHVNLGVSPTPTMCLSLGSNPLAWPEGFYAEGSPLVVFDPAGRPVYVVDQGFTGVDGPAELGYGDGVHLLPGLDLTHCAAEAGGGMEPYTLAMIFADTPGR